MALIESLIFGFFILISLKFYELMVKHFEMKKGVESMFGPKELPLIGIVVKSMHQDIFEYIMNLKDKFESPVKFWFGPTDLVVVVDKPNDIKAVLCSENALDKAPFYKFFNMGNGLFVSDKEIWKVHRKILSRSFNKNQLENSIPVINEKAHELVGTLGKKPEGEEFDMLHEVIDGVLESIFVNFFDLKCVKSIKEKYVENAEKMNRFAMERSTKMLYHSEPFYWFSQLRVKERKLQKNINKYFEDLIENEILPARKASNENNNHSKTQKKLIDFLLDERNEFSNEDIRDHFRATVYGGYDTSTSTIAACLLMMAMHKDVQNKVFEEIKQFMENDDPSCLEDVGKFTYLDMVVKETMRLYPVGAIIGRFSSGKVPLDDGHEIPSGTLIIVNILNIHKNPEHWGKDAEKFIPERFAPEKFNNIHPFAYLPFTGGPRLCLAYKYGTLSIKLFLAHIIRSFEVSTSLKFEEIELDIPIILKIKQGYNMSLRKRRH